eukprot:2821183-Pyramimonas_sp.AAC.1
MDSKDPRPCGGRSGTPSLFFGSLLQCAGLVFTQWLEGDCLHCAPRCRRGQLGRSSDLSS